jgi:hypothetical protein
MNRWTGKAAAATGKGTITTTGIAAAAAAYI